MSNICLNKQLKIILYLKGDVVAVRTHIGGIQALQSVLCGEKCSLKSEFLPGKLFMLSDHLDLDPNVER